MNVTLRSGVLFPLFLFFLTFSTVSSAQTTGLAIIAGANSVIGKLDQVAKTVGQEAKSVSNNLTANISGLIDQLEALGEEQLKKPLNQLSIDMQNLAYKLQAMVDQINSMLSWQIECLFRHADQFVAGLESVILLSTSNLNFIGKKSVPRLTGIQFITSSSSVVVPEEGGWVRLKGHKLNPYPGKPELHPIVRILDKDMKEIKTNLNPSNGASEDEYMIEIEKSVLVQNLGKNIFIEVTPKKRNCFYINDNINILGLNQRYKKYGPYIYPIRVPSKFMDPISVKIFTNSSWSIKSIKEEKTFAKHYDYRNCNCGTTLYIDFDEHFGQIPSNGKVIEGKVNVTHEEFTGDGGRFPTASKMASNPKGLRIDGIVGRPRCAGVCYDDGQLIFDVWPIVEYKQDYSSSHSFQSPNFFLQKNITQNFSVQVGNQNLDQLEIWSEVFINGKLLASSQHVSLGNGTKDALIQQITTKEGYIINISKTGAIINNKVNVSLSITVPPNCAL